MRTRIISAVIAATLLLPTTALAATKKPTPAPTKKSTTSTKKPVVTVKKPTVPSKKSATTTAKKPATSTKKPTVTSTSKAVAKKPVRTVVRRYYKRKRIAPIPSPSPKWPPVNFHFESGIYLKVAITGKELTGVLAAAGKSSQLYQDSQKCSSQVCGVIQVASEDACYWEVDSVLYGPNNVTLGNLSTFTTKSYAKKVTTVFLITPQAISDGYRVAPVTAKCWTTTPLTPVPSNTYTAINN